MYGLLTAACLWWTGKGLPAPRAISAAAAKVALATSILLALYAIGVVWPIHAEFTNFVPTAAAPAAHPRHVRRNALYFVADEWLTRGEGAGRGAYFASKVAFIASLAIAVALDFERLFFLIIIVPLIVLFFVFFGLISRWVYARTHSPSWPASPTPSRLPGPSASSSHSSPRERYRPRIRSSAFCRMMVAASLSITSARRLRV